MKRIETSELAKAFIDEQVELIKKQVGDKKVLLALSGGVDSSTAAYLLKKDAIPDCLKDKVNCISTQTKAYLAANNREFFYLLHFLFTRKPEIEIVTEDKNYHINTIENHDNQKEALRSMVADYVKLNPADYSDWEMQLIREINKIHE